LCPERQIMLDIGYTALDKVAKSTGKTDLWMWTITIESVDGSGNESCYRFGHTGGAGEHNDWSYGGRPGSFDYLGINTRTLSY